MPRGGRQFCSPGTSFAPLGTTNNRRTSRLLYRIGPVGGFGENIRGEKLRVEVHDMPQCLEGIKFLALILLSFYLIFLLHIISLI